MARYPMNAFQNSETVKELTGLLPGEIVELQAENIRLKSSLAQLDSLQNQTQRELSEAKSTLLKVYQALGTRMPEDYRI